MIFTKQSYRPQEVADLLRLSNRTVIRMISDGRLKAIKRNKRVWWIKAEAIMDCLEGR